MKRISTFVALLILLCGVCQGRSVQRHRVHYSTHAFGYHNNGLVPGGTRYSTHAFSYRNNGLIVENQIGPGPIYGPGGIYGPTGVYCVEPIRATCTPVRRRTVTVRWSAVTRQKLREIQRNDGLHVIRRHLTEKGYKDVRLKHHLSIENRTITAAFLVPKKNLLITYRNAEALASLAEETGFKKKAIEKFETDMARTTTALLAKGGRVYGIDASDREQILVAMQDCAELKPAPVVPVPVTMYAKK